MLKKIVVSLTLALVLALGASASFAQMTDPGQLPPEAIKEMEKEGPLTQADIDAYMKIFPQMATGVSSAEEFEKVVADSGLSQMRLGLVMAKVGLGQALAMGATTEQLNLSSVPEVMRPTDAEVELVKNNMDKLMALMTQVAQ